MYLSTCMRWWWKTKLWANLVVLSNITIITQLLYDGDCDAVAVNFIAWTSSETLMQMYLLPHS